MPYKSLYLGRSVGGSDGESDSKCVGGSVDLLRLCA